MGEDNTNTKGSQPDNIVKVLRERERLEQVLKDKFTRKMAIVFSDVSGYTQYMDRWGDLRGRAWIQKHHDIVLPLIEEHDGSVLDIMGDGIMASFVDTQSAVNACVAIQTGLDTYNMAASEADKIHVHIGVNSGEILVDDEGIAGDVVNVASRIQSQAKADQILISKSVYEEVCESDEMLCRFHDTVEVKGKSEPIKLYRVVWKDEAIVLSEHPRVRSHAQLTRAAEKTPLSQLHLEVTREEDRIKISAHEQTPGETSTVRHYEEIPVPMDTISTRCREIVETLNKANRQGRVTSDILVKLRGIGQVFSDDLFPHSVKEAIRGTNAGHLVINMDDQLVQVPWELLYDGRRFLCQRFSMGRLVRTRQSLPGGGKARVLARPLKMLILADPRGDLKGAYDEGTQIRDYIDKERELINAALRSGSISPDYIREKIRNFDVVHFAGHSDYDPQDLGEGGWRLTSGNFKARDIMKMGGSAAMPALIFSNACQSARTEEWGIKTDFQDEIFGLANAFVLAGVKHYVGTFWEILDEPSRLFALEFYKQLLSGMSIGEALRHARMQLITEYGEETIVWASYLLYGDPTFNYLDQIEMAEPSEERAAPAPPSVSISEKETRAKEKEEVIDFSEEETAPTTKKAWWAAAACIIFCVAMLLLGYRWIWGNGDEKYQKEVLAYYNAGDFEPALTTCKVLEKKYPEIRLGYLIQGNIFFRKGKLNAAEAAFQKATSAKKGTGAQKARAYMGLGRIASITKQTDAALNYYRQAAEADPAGGSGYLSQAMLMDRIGKSKEALILLDKAEKLAPDDRIISTVSRETRKKVALTRDREKKERINKLVKELLEDMKSPPRALPSDGWTSLPLTLWIMDFAAKGYAMQEGQERLLFAGISDQILEKSRVQLTERALLDRLLEELKLGTSRLIDRSTALSLGKILAARLMLSGQIVYSGPQTQVSLRLIETETGRITAAISESIGSAAPVSVLSDKISRNFLKKLKTHYPLRGKVSDVKGGEVALNIGHKIGVKIGHRFKVVNEEIALEVISTDQDTSVARIVQGKKVPQNGQRIEIVP